MKILSAIFISLLALQAGHAQDYEFVAVPKGTDVSKLFGPVWVGTATGTLNLAGNNITNVGTLTASDVVAVLGGKLLVNTEGVVSETAGRSYIAMKGSTKHGVMEFSTRESDGDGVALGQIVFASSTTTGAQTRLAQIVGYSTGSSTSNRGGSVIFTTKKDGGVLSEKMRLTDSGALQLTPQSTSPTAVQGGLYFDSDAPVGFYRCTNGTTWTAF